MIGRHISTPGGSHLCSKADEQLVSHLVDNSSVEPADVAGDEIDCWLCHALLEWFMEEIGFRVVPKATTPAT